MYIRSASSPSTVLWAFHTIQPSSLLIYLLIHLLTYPGNKLHCSTYNYNHILTLKIKSIYPPSVPKSNFENFGDIKPFISLLGTPLFKKKSVFACKFWIPQAILLDWSTIRPLTMIDSLMKFLIVIYAHILKSSCISRWLGRRRLLSSAHWLMATLRQHVPVTSPSTLTSLVRSTA